METILTILLIYIIYRYLKSEYYINKIKKDKKFIQKLENKKRIFRNQGKILRLWLINRKIDYIYEIIEIYKEIK